jgi:hypothetical protein
MNIVPEPLVQRFRFVQPGTPITKLYRAFRQPRPIMVVEENIAETDPPAENELRIFAKLPEGMPSLKVKSGSASIEWRPGQASVNAPKELRDDLVSALVEFTYYEGELRRLEAALAEGLPEAERDTEFAFQIRPQDQVHRARVTERMKSYTKMRLEFAQLEFFLSTPCGELSRESKRWMKALLRKADVEARAEALGDQLELREELYEGAADRFTDYWGWAHGHKLEVLIIVLLVFEFLVMTADLILHIHEMGKNTD